MFKFQRKEMPSRDENLKNGFSEDNITHQLVSYIYNSVDLAKFKFEMIQFETDLPKLLKQKYFVSANFVGQNCLLVFCKIREKFYSFLVDRQTLSYNIRKVDMEKVKIEHKTIGLDSSIYAGSIIDGILVRGGKTDTFIISDVYRFRGTDYTHINLDTKLMSIVEYLKSSYDQESDENTLTLTVNKAFPLIKTEHFCKNVIPAIKNFKTRGLAFYPEESGTKLIFLFGNEKKNPQMIQQANKLFNSKPDTGRQTHNEQTAIKNTVNNEKEYKYINRSGKDVFATLEMKSTEKVDVYKLFAVEKVEKKEGDKTRTMLRRVKMGLAYVPGIEKSGMCRDLLSKNAENKVLVKCKFNNDKSKWEPIEEIKNPNNDKIPSLLDEIESKLELIEDDSGDE